MLKNTVIIALNFDFHIQSFFCLSELALFLRWLALGIRFGVPFLNKLSSFKNVHVKLAEHFFVNSFDLSNLASIQSVVF